MSTRVFTYPDGKPLQAGGCGVCGGNKTKPSGRRSNVGRIDFERGSEPRPIQKPNNK